MIPEELKQILNNAIIRDKKDILALSYIAETWDCVIHSDFCFPLSSDPEIIWFEYDWRSKEKIIGARSILANKELITIRKETYRRDSE